METGLSIELRFVYAASQLPGFWLQRSDNPQWLSIPSNIAEGFERGSEKAKRQFLLYARGSAAELKTQIQIGSRVGFIRKQKAPALLDEVSAIQKMLGALISTLRSSGE